MKCPTRRMFLASALGGTLASGCRTRSVPAPFGGEELTIFVPDSQESLLRSAFVPVFEKKTGASVSLLKGPDPVKQLKDAPAKKPPFDLVVCDGPQAALAVRDGLFAQFDPGNIPNVKNLAASAVNNWIYRDGYGVTLPGAGIALVYNRVRNPKPPKSWSDLLRKTLAGLIGLSRDYRMSLVTIACMMVDLDGKAGTAHDLIEKDLTSVLTFAKGHRDRVKRWWADPADMIQATSQNEVGAGNLDSRSGYEAFGNKPDLGTMVPNADRVFEAMVWSMPAHSPNQELAQRALDLILSDEVQMGFARAGLPTAIPAVAAKRAEQDSRWKALYPHTEEQLKAIRYYPDEVYSAKGKELIEEWNRQVLGGA